MPLLLTEQKYRYPEVRKTQVEFLHSVLISPDGKGQNLRLMEKISSYSRREIPHCADALSELFLLVADKTRNGEIEVVIRGKRKVVHCTSF
jgi:hypothetical protein